MKAIKHYSNLQGEEYEQETLYRRTFLSYKQIEKLKLYRLVALGGFISTSLDAHVAESFDSNIAGGKDVIIEIKTERGSNRENNYAYI